MTSIFVKNSLKNGGKYFWSPPHLRRYTESVIAPFFDNFKLIKTSVKFGKNSRNTEVPKGKILAGLQAEDLVLCTTLPTSVILVPGG